MNVFMEAVARPLYLQVREALLARMADGEWKAGTALPSEFALAAELGVSQGTVRKALDALAAENLVLRRQGRGTFVPEHTEERALFHFFRMQDADGRAVLPQPLSQQIELVMPSKAVAKALDAGRRKLWRVARVRTVNGRPAIVEHIYLDPKRFPALDAQTALPNALYSFYQTTAGISIARADDRLSAVPAPADVAAELGVAPGAPLLFAERLAYDLRDEVAELRLSWFDTGAQSYLVSLW